MEDITSHLTVDGGIKSMSHMTGVWRVLTTSIYGATLNSEKSVRIVGVLQSLRLLSSKVFL